MNINTSTYLFLFKNIKIWCIYIDLLIEAIFNKNKKLLKYLFINILNKNKNSL